MLGRSTGVSERIVRLVAPGRLLVLGLALVAVTTAASAANTAATRPNVTAPVAYAAMGDSYTSGPLIPVPSLSPLGCLRSDHNYPHLVAATLGLDLTDVSCSGATTANMTSVQKTAAGVNPPQLGAVTSADKVVTLGIGGNDIGFIRIIENCAAASPFGPTRVGWTCKSHYTTGGIDRIAAAIRAVTPRLEAVLTSVHRLAPAAKVFVVGYPAILPPTGHGCWPRMPFTYTDVPYLRGEELRLNRVLAQAAAAEGATYVDTYTGSTGHTVCTPERTRWVEPLVPDSLATPVHPNAAGESALAGFVIAAVRAAGAGVPASSTGRPH
jgi:lysophospholipase L1-like esterase